LLKRAFKYGYVKSIITVEELLASYDDQLMIITVNIIYYLLPSLINTD